jgi:glutaredoxin
MKIEIYTKDACPLCIQAKALVKSKGLDYVEHFIGVDNRSLMIEELTTRLGQAPRQVPQIFIDGDHIGGFTQLKEMLP